jgi:hypothetical protein
MTFKEQHEQEKKMNRFASVTKPLMWSMALLLSALAAGCGQSRDPVLGVGSGVPVAVVGSVDLGLASTFGTFGGSAGMTNQGTLTVITGSGGLTADIGTIATGTSSITGFHDANTPVPDIYTETGANIGSVTGRIYTCTVSTTGPTSGGVNAASCTLATQARLDAEIAYLDLVSRPSGPVPTPGANLAGLTLAPSVYTSSTGFLIQDGLPGPAGDLTLDGQGNANAVWVFQSASTLTVGGPGAAFPRSVNCINGCQAKNVFWQVGSAATINAAGGGTMVGTIISQAGATFSTAGVAATTTLNGRALSLGASVTMVNTLVNVPAP